MAAVNMRGPAYVTVNVFFWKIKIFLPFPPPPPPPPPYSYVINASHSEVAITTATQLAVSRGFELKTGLVLVLLSVAAWTESYWINL